MRKIKVALDVGNTEIVVGIYHGEELVNKSRKPTGDFTSMLLKSWLEELIGEDEPIKIGLSCVVPRFYKEIIDCCDNIAETLTISPANLPDLVIQAENRDELGADFIGVYFGAITKYSAPLIIFDLGSATKTMIINEKQEIEGVAIKPGIRQSLDAMVTNIPHLPNIELGQPEDIIGHNTVEAIKSGIFYGELANIKYYGNLLDEHYDFTSTKILTGGYSWHFYDQLPNYHHEPDLLLAGINKIIDNS